MTEADTEIENGKETNINIDNLFLVLVYTTGKLTCKHKPFHDFHIIFCIKMNEIIIIIHFLWPL